MIRTATIVLALAALLAAASPAHAAPGYGCRGAQALTGQASKTRLISAVRCVANAERRRHGLARVAAASSLRRAAAGHAASMARNDFFSHVSLDGRTIVDRVLAASAPNEWNWAGEVLGWGCGRAGSPASIVSHWMASPTHRAVVLDPRPTHVGVTFAKGTPVRSCARGVTWTAEFGRAN